MKRILMVMLAVMLCIGLAACKIADTATDETHGSGFSSGDSEEETDTPEETKAPKESETGGIGIPEKTRTTEESPAVTEEAVAIVYTNADLDLFIMVYAPDWEYSSEIIQGEVFFYPADAYVVQTNTGFAISSNEADTSDNSLIAQTWDSAASMLGQTFADFEWEQAAPVGVGAYTAQRYHFTMQGFFGDYFIWVTESRIYICSLTAEADEYDQVLAMLLESLGTFQVLSDM
ncbi:MAG: hypothetical protein PHO15_00690 [Eubacteriales bacterium]|nr:hypothetical protein [Eubacteriales bacterium]